MLEYKLFYFNVKINEESVQNLIKEMHLAAVYVEKTFAS